MSVDDFLEATTLLLPHKTKKFIREENAPYVNGDNAELRFKDEIMRSLAEDMFDAEFVTCSRMVEHSIPFIILLLTFAAGLYGNLSFVIESLDNYTLEYIIPMIMGFILIGVSLGLLTATIRWFHKQIVRRTKIKDAYTNLKRSGKILQGEIREVRLRRREKKTRWVIFYVFTNPEGKQVLGKFLIPRSISRNDIDLSVGDNVYVLYLNDDVKILL